MKQLARAVAIAAFIVTIGTAPAQAQQPRPDAGLVDALARCLDIADGTARLACTDVAARALVDATRKRDVVIVDRAEVKETRRSLFGFGLPRIGLFGRDGPDRGEEIAELTEELATVGALPHGRFALTMKGGARWNTTEEWAGAVLPRPGSMLTVRRGAMGGYFVRLAGGRAVRALRVG